MFDAPPLLSVDWAGAADGLLGHVARRPCGEGQAQAPFAVLRFPPGPGGMLIQGLKWHVPPIPQRTILCDGRPYIEYGMRQPRTVTFDQIVAPKAIFDEFVARYGNVTHDFPDVVLDVGEPSGPNGLMQTVLRIVVERPIIQQMGSVTRAEDMTITGGIHLICQELWVE